MAYAEAVGSEEVEAAGSKPNFQLIGIGIGVFGVVAAAAIGWFMVKPAWEKNQELTTKLAELEGQIREGATLDQQVKRAQEDKAKAEQQKEEVTALFASEKALDTLLLDLNRIVDAREASMNRFRPSAGPPEVILDGSLGPLVNGKLKSKEVQMELTGTFDQTRSILLTMERLQPLLVVKDFRTQVDNSTKQEVSYKQGRLTITGTPKLKTSLTIQALMPAELPSAEENAKK